MKTHPHPSKPPSPMMAQWYACKKKAKDAILLFRLGDFYEAFYEDASLLSRELDITLTQRQGIPMSGIPAHTCEGYIEKLIEKGYLVAVAEQVEDPKKVKGLVKREIVKTISPGTVLNGSFLADKTNNFFVCLSQINSVFAIVSLDISTGELHVLEIEREKDLQDELFRRRPSEILISEKCHSHIAPLIENLKKQFNFRLAIKEEWHFDHRTCYEWLTRHFKVHNLDGLGLKGMIAAINAMGALLAHVNDDLSLSIDHIENIHLDHLSDFMAIDHATQKNLELTESLHQASQDYTLLKLLDKTKTPMGARLLKSWLIHPLLSSQKIRKRQDAIEELLTKLDISRKLSEKLQSIRDLERLIMRIATGYSSPRDITGLRFSLENIPSLLQIIEPLNSSAIQEIKTLLPDTRFITDKIKQVLVDEPPIKMGEGGIIREGFHQKLDEIRSLKKNSQTWIAEYQAKLKETTGVKTLKIIYSKAFGYCIEVSRGQADRIPESFQRRQTLVNAERFISPELKTYEEKILTAEERINAIEQELYQNLRQEIAQHTKVIKSIAQGIAKLDCLLSFAQVALKNNYVRPVVDESDVIDIQVGRHPVIESSLIDDSFIPNDTHLNNQDHCLLLITGPNMAGKSTYIRQVALITIMAQTGSFVPAKSAHIGIVDKVFSRIGASDDLSRGQSTFMIEMTETANILNNATPRSLVILDEIGRGTSTYDGISIAWSVVEHLLSLNGEGVKTLFATHYWELTELEKQHPGVKNLNVAVKESADNIVFLHKIIKGSTDKSYGIHVARLAGLPHSTIKRARDILKTLEQKAPNMQKPAPQEKSKPQDQLTFFSAIDPKDEEAEEVIEEMKKLDLNTTAPIDAMQQIAKWQEKLNP